MMKTELKIVWILAIAVMAVCSASDAANRITVVTSHSPGKSKDELASKGNLSAYVQVNGKAILCDTGKHTNPLPQKLDQLGLEVNLIEAVVFTHNQLDGVPDLSEVLISTDKPKKVFVPAPLGNAGVFQNLNAKVVEVSEPAGVITDAWLVGPLEVEHKNGTTAEQVLVLDRPDGLVVIVGCSHPGIVSVVKKVKEVFGARKIKMVAGGFHLQSTSKTDIKEISLGLQTMGIDTLALSSCTGESALKIFRKEWGNRVVSFDSGDRIGF
jgi:7,8-dihydropterin-6-yl-methyl-4-(beta-D-ribofuranosyl)aminobenzene 5'-phosphate synthase